LESLPDGATDWDRLASAYPAAFAALAKFVGAAWQDSDPVLLELARLRIAMLLRYPEELSRLSSRAREAGVDETKVAELPSWPTSPLFSACERACLALTEQFVMDANGVTDALVAEVNEHLGGSGCYAFVEGVSVFETFQRTCLTLGIRSAPGPDEFAVRATGDATTMEEIR
jgi:alkylhydroperoxidase family enzyme